MKIGVAGGTGTVGQHVVELIRQQGHRPVVLARSTGFDLLTGTGLPAALDGVEAVIDVVSIPTLSGRASTRFFATTTATLLAAEVRTGVGHHVALSIVNAGRVAAGYYAGKALQENRVQEGAVPWTILRATQFHEFAAQTLARGSRGRVALVPVMRTQPVAAREVAQRLVRLALGAPRGRATDLGGPKEETLGDMVRDYARATHARSRVVQIRLPGRMGQAMQGGGMLPAPAAEHGSQSFAQWLDDEVRPGQQSRHP